MDNFGKENFNLPLFILYIFFKCISFFTTLFSSIAVRKIEPTVLELCGPFESISGRCSNVIWLNENVLGSKRRRYKFFKLPFYWKAYIKSNLAITVLFTVKNFAVISARHSYCDCTKTCLGQNLAVAFRAQTRFNGVGSVPPYMHKSRVRGVHPSEMISEE